MSVPSKVRYEDSLCSRCRQKRFCGVALSGTYLLQCRFYLPEDEDRIEDMGEKDV